MNFLLSVMHCLFRLEHIEETCKRVLVMGLIYVIINNQVLMAYTYPDTILVLDLHVRPAMPAQRQTNKEICTRQ